MCQFCAPDRDNARCVRVSQWPPLWLVALTLAVLIWLAWLLDI